MDGCYLQSLQISVTETVHLYGPTFPRECGNDLNSLCFLDTVITSHALIIIIVPTSLSELCNITGKFRIA